MALASFQLGGKHLGGGRALGANADGGIREHQALGRGKGQDGGVGSSDPGKLDGQERDKGASVKRLQHAQWRGAPPFHPASP